jgi:hypothetical protein
VWKGTTLQSEHNLLEPAVAIVPFYSDLSTPRLPALAVAAGPFVFIYRNLRPYYKFTIPPVDINPQEADVWADVKSDKLDFSKVNMIMRMTLMMIIIPFGELWLWAPSSGARVSYSHFVDQVCRG